MAPDAYLVPGERAVVELLRSDPRRVRRLLVLPGHAEVVRLASEAGVAIDVCTPDAIIDEILFEHLMLNLLENAAKYTPAGSPIDISARALDGSVVVDVADRGPGIAAGQRERIFDKFVRGDGRPDGGFGLGLAICRAIAAAHAGSIIATERPGGGTIFRITLPIEEEPASSMETAA